MLIRKLFLSFLFAFVVSFIVFALLQYYSIKSIYKKHEDALFLEKALQEEVENLQEYVDQNDISLDNIYKLTRWIDRDKITSVALYYEDRLIYDSSISYHAGTIDSGIIRKPLPWEKLYPLRLKDTSLKMSLKIYFKQYEYIKALFKNLIIFFLVFTSIIIFFIHKKTKQVLLIEQQIQLMKGGVLNMPIEISGNDEIIELATSLDEMRRSLIDLIDNEKKANQNKRNFISSMSHDIRTPLSILISYLDIMHKDNKSFEPEHKEYLIKCVEKANQIKYLTDNLFNQFVENETSNSNDEMSNVVNIDVIKRTILDAIFFLKTSDYDVIYSSELTYEGNVFMQIKTWQRIIDNLVSNIVKYADLKEKVSILLKNNDDKIVINIINKIDEMKKDSNTGIGLITCQNLLIKNKASMVIKETEFDFNIEIKLLMDKMEEYNEKL